MCQKVSWNIHKAAIWGLKFFFLCKSIRLGVHNKNCGALQVISTPNREKAHKAGKYIVLYHPLLVKVDFSIAITDDGMVDRELFKMFIIE